MYNVAIVTLTLHNNYMHLHVDILTLCSCTVTQHNDNKYVHCVPYSYVVTCTLSLLDDTVYCIAIASKIVYTVTV